MKVKVHNDGKEKPQSFEASLEEARYYNFDYNFDIVCNGFGATEEEAIKNMEAAATHIYSMIGDMPMEGKHEIIYVDCFGKELK